MKNLQIELVTNSCSPAECEAIKAWAVAQIVDYIQSLREKTGRNYKIVNVWETKSGYGCSLWEPEEMEVAGAVD
jgi:hypothetical protein